METLTFDLEVFSGPLELLLSLISKNKVSIYDIPIAVIFDQYMEYIDQMKQMNMDVASEFIEMAAHLIYIKSRMLLPKEEIEEDDPRMPLAMALAEYQRYQSLLPEMHDMNLKAAGSYTRMMEVIEFDKRVRRQYEASALIKAYHDVMDKVERREPPTLGTFKSFISRKITSVSVKIASVLRSLKRLTRVRFTDLFKGARTRSDIVATFLAVLELSKTEYVRLEQQQDEIMISYDKNKEGDTYGAE